MTSGSVKNCNILAVFLTWQFKGWTLLLIEAFYHKTRSIKTLSVLGHIGSDCCQNDRFKVGADFNKSKPIFNIFVLKSINY